jgi:hypothetical protein
VNGNLKGVGEGDGVLHGGLDLEWTLESWIGSSKEREGECKFVCIYISTHLFIVKVSLFGLLLRAVEKSGNDERHLDTVRGTVMLFSDVRMVYMIRKT